MKNINQTFQAFAVFAVILVNCASASATGFSLQKKKYFSATYFEMMEGSRPEGTVVRSNWTVAQSVYEGYDAAGNPTFRASTRWFGLGNFFSWATHLVVCDHDGTMLGTLDGEFFTMATARFRLYDATGNPVGVTYVDRSNVGATVLPDDWSNQWVARHTRRREADFAPDRWEAEFFDEQRVHPHVLTALAAVLSDLQDSLFPATAYY